MEAEHEYGSDVTAIVSPQQSHFPPSFVLGLFVVQLYPISLRASHTRWVILPTLTCNCIYRHLTWILVHFLRQRPGIPSIGIAPGAKKDLPQCLLNEKLNSLYRT